MGDDTWGRGRGYAGAGSNDNKIGQIEDYSRGEDVAEKAKEESYVQARH
jgi:hypothetical protein